MESLRLWATRTKEKAGIKKARKIPPSSPATWAAQISEGKWRHARHLDYLDRKLVDVAKRTIMRLMVQMPPRHGKSELVGRYFVAWYLLTFPWHRVIYASYAQQQAMKYGRFVRKLIEEYGAEYGVFISSERATQSEFELVDADGHPWGGSMVSAGVAGSLTGKGADLLVIDDPIKNHEEALSDVMRDKTWDFWAADASTRLSARDDTNPEEYPGGVVVEIQTRWHEDDLGGRMESAMAAGGDQWEIVRFPAIAEESDILGRVMGEALWPEMFPVDNLIQTKIRLGAYWFSAEYQQHPSPLEGSFFKKVDWRYFTVVPGGTLRDGPYILHRPGMENLLIQAGQGTLLITVDLATSEKTIADYTVWAIGRVLPNGLGILILDVVREHLQGPEIGTSTVALKQQWEPDLIGVEKKGFQLAIIQGIWRMNVPVHELDVKGDKVGRALPMSARVAAHSVFLHQGAGYIADFVDEHATFPRGTHDDQVDASAYLGLEAERLGLGDAWVQAAADEAEKIQKANRGLL